MKVDSAGFATPNEVGKPQFNHRQDQLEIGQTPGVACCDYAAVSVNSEVVVNSNSTDIGGETRECLDVLVPSFLLVRVAVVLLN